MRVFRLSRIKDKVSYATKAEHDFTAPDDFDPVELCAAGRLAARRNRRHRPDLGLGADRVADRARLRPVRVDGEARQVGLAVAAGSRRVPGPGVVFTTEYAQPRQLIAWVLGIGEHVRLLEPSEVVDEAAERLSLIVERHEPDPDFVAEPKRRRARPVEERANGKPERSNGQGDTPIRPERFARLVALAGILIQSARHGSRPRSQEVCERLQITEQELREDVDVLNVVNFGGGSYVLYAEVQGDEIDVDPEPYSDNFARPARLLPLEAKALVAAIDLLGDHLPEGSLG